MAKFCTNCGSPLTDGKCEKCTKEKEVKEEKKEVKKDGTISIEADNKIGVDIVTIYKEILTKPFTMIKSIFETGSIKIAWIIMAIASGVIGIADYFFIKQIYIGTYSLTASSFGVSAQVSTDAINNVFKEALIKIIIAGFIVSFIYFVIYAIVSKLIIGNVFKGKGEAKDYLLITAGASVLYSIFTVGAAVLSYVSWKIACVALIVGGIAFFILTIQGFTRLLDADKEKLCYSVPIACVLTIIVLGIVISILKDSVVTNKTTNIPLDNNAQQSIFR